MKIILFVFKHRLLGCVLISVLLASFNQEPAMAQEQNSEQNSEQNTQLKSPESRRLLENLEQQLTQTFSAIAEEERKLGNNLKGFSYQMQLAASQQYVMGLVLDTRNLKEGLRIVAVEPGSAAERAGLKLNDSIVEIDEIKITGDVETEALSYLLKPRENDTLQLRVKSNSDYKDVALSVPQLFIPKITLQVSSGSENSDTVNTQQLCGILKFGSRSVALKMNNAALSAIDGRDVSNIRPYAMKTVPLPPGKHRIKVSRAIWPDGNAVGVGKPLDIEVEANTKYFIGIRYFDMDQWIPTVYKKEQAECELD